MTKNLSKTRAMIECALLVAIGTILAQIKIIDMPYGGSVTLFSMVPFVLISFRHGLTWGLISGFANGLLQMLFGLSAPPVATLLSFTGMILLDYILAFMVFGLACTIAKLFKNKLIGVGAACVFVCLLRFLCSFLSGILIWGAYQSYYDWAVNMPVWLYSLIYNGGYMLPELIITTIAVLLLYKAATFLFSAVIEKKQ